MRPTASIALALLTLAGAPAGAAAAQRHHRRALCVRYRCTTVAQDRLVRVLRAESRHPGEESEAEAGHWLHYAVWKPSGRAWPLGDRAVEQDSDGVLLTAVSGPWTAYVEVSCSHETLACSWVVQRLDAQTGRHDQVLGWVPGETVPLPASIASCLAFDTTGNTGVSSLALGESGTVAWIQFGDVCELPHDARVPALLASGPGIAPRSLELADGFFIWRDGEALGSAPAS